MVRLLLIIVISSLLMNCTKDSASYVDFDVRLNSQNMYKIDEDITFDFIGNPDYINFYSGELGNNYYADEVELDKDGYKATLTFDKIEWQRMTATNTDLMKMYVVQDFDELTMDFDTDRDAILGADLKDLSAHINIPSPIVRNNVVSIDPIDLSEYVDMDKPFSLVLHAKHSNSTLKPTWIFFNMSVLVQKYGVLHNIMQGSDLGFTAIDVLNEDNEPYLSLPPSGTTINSRWNLRVPDLELRFQTASADTGVEDDYLISKPISLENTVENKIVAIKDVRERLSSFTYRYRSPGTYQAVFVARNFENGSIQEKVVSFNVVIDE